MERVGHLYDHINPAHSTGTQRDRKAPTGEKNHSE